MPGKDDLETLERLEGFIETPSHNHHKADHRIDGLLDNFSR